MGYAKAVVCALGALFLGACASLEHRPLTSADDDSKKDQGIRYYETSPYLIVYSDTNGNILSKIEYLPDQTRLMSVKPTCFLAKLESELSFENGTLKSSSASVDETVIAKAAITAVKTVMLRGMIETKEHPELAEYKYPPVHVFKIVVNGDTVSFYGAQSSGEIHVSIVAAKAAEKKDKADDSGK